MLKGRLRPFLFYLDWLIWVELHDGYYFTRIGVAGCGIELHKRRGTYTADENLFEHGIRIEISYTELTRNARSVTGGPLIRRRILK